MRITLLAVVLFGLLVTSSEAFARRSARGLSKNFYWDYSYGLGYVLTDTPSGNSSPTILQHTLGTTIGWEYAKWGFVGFTMDFRFIGQVSAPVGQAGNRSGTRFNYFSPTLGFVMKRLTVKMDYQFAGTYTLTEKTYYQEDLCYQNPMGFRVVAAIRTGKKVHLGLFYENLEFGSSKEGGTTTTLSTKRNLSQAGLMFIYLLK